MRQTEFGRALRLVLGELREIIEKAGRRTTVEAGPEGRFADGGASGGDHVAVIVGDAADHVGMRLDVTHGNQCLPGQAPQAALVVAAGMGPVVGSLRANRTRSARPL